MTKLELQSRSGDAVHAGQTMSRDVGFSCVSRLWYNKTLPMDAGIEQVCNERQKREDIIAPAGNVQFGLEGKSVTITIGDRKTVPTLHALKLAAEWCGRLPQTLVNHYLKPEMDDGDRETLVKCYSNGLRHVDPTKEFRFRTYQDGTLRAWVSTEYAPIDNVWMLETYKQLMPEGRLSHWRGDGDNLYGNILLPDSVRESDDSDYGGLIAIGNSEIRMRRFTQEPSIFRAICMNGCIWDRNKGYSLSYVHKGEIDLDTLRIKMMENVNEQIPLVSSAIERFLSTRSYELKTSELVPVFAQLAIDYRLTPSEIQTVAKEYHTHESAFRSLFGIVNAITRAGQSLDNDNWVRFDQLGGSLVGLSRSHWDSIRTGGSRLSKEQVEKALGLAS